MSLLFKINSLRKLAEKYAKEITDNNEIWKQDVTELVEKEIRYQIGNGEIVISEVRAKPRLGKSTFAIELAMEVIDDELKACGKKDKKLVFGMRNIARDDQEYSKLMRNPELKNDIIVTDEQNELEKGGENATTEQQLKDVFSDVQAGRYIHRICVSPESEVDKNSDILFEIVGIDAKAMITHARVYYRINNAQQKLWQPIGYFNLYVGKLIGNWERNVKPIFNKSKRTEADEKYIREQSRKDFYVQYMIKKYEKMELLTKESILRPRELDYAEAVLNVTNHLKPLTRVMDIGSELIRNYMEIEFKKLKLVGSMIGIRQASDRVLGVLKLEKNIWKVKGQKAKTINRMKEDGEDKKRIKAIEKEYDKVLAELDEAIQIVEIELNRYAEINEKYNSYLH